MGTPVSIRLDDDVRDELEAEARSRGIGLATLVRDLATRAAHEARRARIRAESEAVGRYVASNPAARELYAELGTPRSFTS